MTPKVMTLARGRWPEILRSFGVDERYLRNAHGPCPICAGGKDRFRFDDKGGNGTFICSVCGAGDGMNLVQRLTGLSFRHAATEVESILGDHGLPRPAPTMLRPRSAPEKSRRIAEWIWRSSTKPGDDTPSAKYLARRIGSIDIPASIRHCAELTFVDENSRIRTRHPGMIALVTDAHSEFAAIHRTYLDEAGRKAMVPHPKRLLGCPPPGSAIRLAPAATSLGIAEGIENALAATFLFGLPVWSATSAALLRHWTPPAEVREVAIFADNDPSGIGMNAARVLEERLQKAGLTVRIETPANAKDWADVLDARRASGDLTNTFGRASR